MLEANYFCEHGDSADLRQRTLRAGAFTVMAQLISLTLTIASNILFARLLSPQDFGLIAMVAPIAGLLGFFRDMGLSASTVQQPRISHEQVSTLFWINVALTLALMVLTAGLAPVLGWFYRRQEITWIMLAFAANFLIGGLTIQHGALLRRKMEFGSLAKVSVGSTIGGIVVGIIGAAAGWRYWALVAASLANSLCALMLTFWFCRWRPGRPVRKAGVGNMVAFGGCFTGGNLLYSLSGTLESFFIGHSQGAELLGHYNRAYSLYLQPVQQITMPLTNIAVPALSRLQGHPERYRNGFLKMAERLAWINTAVAAVFIVAGDHILMLLLGSQWTEAARLVRVLAWAGLISPISGSTSWLLTTQGRGKDLVLWGLANVGLKVIALSLGLLHGIEGVAIAVVISSYLGFLLYAPFVGRKGPVSSGCIYRLALGSGITILPSLGAGLVIRKALAHENPVVLIAATGFTIFLVKLLITCISQSGRSSLTESIQMLRELANGALRRLTQPVNHAATLDTPLKN